MKCNDIKLKISEYIDGMLNVDENKLFEDHLHKCDECNIYYQNFKMMIESLNEIDLVEPPIDFNEQLNKKLVEEKRSVKNTLLNNKKPILVAAAMLLVTVISVPLVGNINLGSSKQYGSESSMDIASEERASYGEKDGLSFNITSNKVIPPSIPLENDINRNDLLVLNDEEETVNQQTIEEKVVEDRKIIRNGRMTLEVESFDDVYNAIIRDVESSNGFIQNSEVYHHTVNKGKPEESLKSANVVIRVPSSQFLSTFEKIKERGITIDESIEGRDITDEYYDIENESYNLKIQEERLREVLKKADKVEDILRIENELGRIRSQINRLDSSLTNYDKLVSLSTINLYIRQVKPDQIQINTMSIGLLSKARNNFIDSVNKVISLAEKIFIGTFTILPIVFVIALLGVPIWIFFKKKNNSKM